jgi:predicted transcriptional regulator
MSITIELSPEVEQALRADAEAQGVDIKQIAAERLEEAYRSTDPELIEALRKGIDALDAGDSLSIEEYVAQIKEERRLRDQPTHATT